MKQKIDFLPYRGSLTGKAFKPGLSRGRRYPSYDDEDGVLNSSLDPFFLDREKLRLSKFLRRLSDKTQVFINHKENIHIRNRRVHTDEVASLAATMAEILGLNVYLVEAIALGHDLGHSPFGHLGERAITELSGQPFRHEIMGVVIAQKIERSGMGLNLSWETLEGILNHSRGGKNLEINRMLPLEYALVMLADKIAYTFSDLNDAIRCDYFTVKQLPAEFSALGSNQRDCWQNCIFSLIKESSEKGTISFCESEVAQQFESLRQWSYVNFYKQADAGEPRRQALGDLKSVYTFLTDWQSIFGYSPLLSLSVMTDEEVRKIAQFAKYPMIRNKEMLEKFSFAEILSRLPKDRNIDIFDADLHANDFICF